jgi:hypothetical protein
MIERNKVKISALILLSFSLTGCGGQGIIGEAIVSLAPSHDEVVANWSSVPSNKSRVVFFVPKYNDATCKIHINDQIFFWYGGAAGTFIFEDIIPGEHTFTCGSVTNSFEFELSGGEIYYIKIDRKMNENVTLQVVDEPNVNETMKEINHFYNDHLPLREQTGLNSVIRTWDHFGYPSVLGAKYEGASNITSQDLTGTYKSEMTGSGHSFRYLNLKSRSVKVQLIQDGNKVHGWFGQKENKIKGVVDGDTINLILETQRGSGKAKWTIDSAKRKIIGTYSAGPSDGGKWILRRISR